MSDSESRVHIVQCLCPQRHCTMALAYQPGLSAAQRDFGSTDDITLTVENATGYLRSMIEGMVARRVLNPWCEICKSPDLWYEDGVSQFRTVEEAQPFIEAMERRQAASQIVISRYMSGMRGKN